MSWLFADIFTIGGDEEEPRQCRGIFHWVALGPQFPATVLLLQFLVVLGVTLFLQTVFRPFRIPRLASYMTAGFFLGPQALGRFFIYKEKIFPRESIGVLKCIALTGYCLYLFAIAVKMDFGIIFKAGRKAWWIGVFVPLITVSISTVTRYVMLGLRDDSGVAFGTTFASVISFPVVAIFLTDMELLNSEIGRLALSASLVCEFSAIFIMAVINNAGLAAREGLATGVRYLGMILLLLVVVRYFFRPLMKWMIRQTPPGRPVKDIYVNVTFLLMLVGAWWSDKAGQFVLLGAFIVGAGVPEGPPLGSAMEERFDSLIFGLLEPFAITAAFMRVDLALFDHRSKVTRSVLSVSVAAVITRVVSCCLFTYFTKMDLTDAMTLGLIFSTKGTIDFASYAWWSDLDMVSEETLAALMVGATVTSAVCTVGVKYLYDPTKKYAGYERRDIAHNKLNAELRMLLCIHRPEDVSCFTNLLDLYSPTITNPLTANVLHLVKLTGRCHPVVISHDLQNVTQKDSFYCPYAAEVLLSFNRLKRAHGDGLAVHAFTAVAPPTAMHANICDLALDKLASVILLPFHKKLGIDGTGSVEFDDQEQRALNSMLLARSPCSVAILVNRSHHHKHILRTTNNKVGAVMSLEDPGMFSVAVIFIGGNDDVEAFAFAKRVSIGNRIRLTVIRLVLEDQYEDDELPISDSLALRDIKHDVEAHRLLTYVELTVRDGPDTALKLRSIFDDFNLLIVGRRYGVESFQTSGLSQWSETPELGILGDLLSSPDTNCKASVMVVQRQLLRTTLR